MKLIELTGRRFGALTVVGRVGSRSHTRNRGNNPTWACLCDCGNTVTVIGFNLREGRTVTCGCKTHRLRPSQANIHVRFLEYKNNANRTGRKFDLTEEEFGYITRLPCHYCGSSPINGVDRRDNRDGYTMSNSLPCCSFCNRGKGTMSYGEFMGWAKRVMFIHN